METTHTGSRAELKTIREFAGVALSNYKDDQRKTADLFILVDTWSRVTDEEDRKLLGHKIIGLLNKHGVEDQSLAREVLHYVGTPICKCRDEDAWKAISRFMQADCLLSVNLAALSAAVRLAEKHASKECSDVAKKHEHDIERLSKSRSPDAQQLAARMLELSAAL